MTTRRIEKIIGQNIAYYRHKKHLTQEELVRQLPSNSDEARIVRQQLSKIELGERHINVALLYYIATVLEIDINCLLKEEH